MQGGEQKLKLRSQQAGIEVRLSLGAAVCLRHESVPFEVTVANRAERAIEIAGLEAKNLSLELQLTSRYGQRTANQLSASSRDGVPYHAPDRLRVTTLEPSGALTLSGDLLDYLGGIDPGEYTVTAVYQAIPIHPASAPVSLRVLPVNPVQAITPRFSTRLRSAPLPTAWVHKDRDGLTLLYQEQSPSLPSNPRHGYRIATNFQGRYADVALLPDEDCPAAHVIWQETAEALSVAAVSRQQHGLSSAWQMQLPFPGRALRSPQSSSSGAAWIPVASGDQRRFAVLRTSPQEPGSVYELNMEGRSAVGHYANLWDYEANLYFVWGPWHGKELNCARLSLTEPDAGFELLDTAETDGETLWFDGYMRLTDADEREPILWCVRRKPEALMCGRYNMARKTWVSDAMLLTSGMPELTVMSSAVTSQEGLALLLIAPSGSLYYGSTAMKAIKLLESLAGRPITRDDHPALVTEGGHGVHPWVHIRYADREAGRIAVVKLEPASASDAMSR